MLLSYGYLTDNFYFRFNISRVFLIISTSGEATSEIIKKYEWYIKPEIEIVRVISVLYNVDKYKDKYKDYKIKWRMNDFKNDFYFLSPYVVSIKCLLFPVNGKTMW